MRSLAFIQVASYGAALEAVNVISNYEQLKLVEMIPMGGASVLFLESTYNTLNHFRRNLRTADLQKSQIFVYSERVIDIFYHKENGSPARHILVLEGVFVGDLFSVIVDSLDEITIMDFSLSRSIASENSMVLTSDSEGAIKKILLKAEKLKVRAIFFENPSPDLKQFFDIN